MIFWTSISVEKTGLCYMDTDSFYLAMSGDFLDEIFEPEMKQTHGLTRKIGLQQTNLTREHPAYLNLSL